jgi:hypothetical protein
LIYRFVIWIPLTYRFFLFFFFFHFLAGYILGECDDTRKIWISLVVVTLPTAVFRTIVHKLFTMPCLLHDMSKTKKTMHFLLLCFADVASGVAYLFSIAWCVVFGVAGFFFWYKAYSSNHSQCGNQDFSVVSEFAYFLYTVAQCKHIYISCSRSIESAFLPFLVFAFFCFLL